MPPLAVSPYLLAILGLGGTGLMRSKLYPLPRYLDTTLPPSYQTNPRVIFSRRRKNRAGSDAFSEFRKESQVDGKSSYDEYFKPIIDWAGNTSLGQFATGFVTPIAIYGLARGAQSIVDQIHDEDVAQEEKEVAELMARISQPTVDYSRKRPFNKESSSWWDIVGIPLAAADWVSAKTGAPFVLGALAGVPFAASYFSTKEQLVPESLRKAYEDPKLAKQTDLDFVDEDGNPLPYGLPAYAL